MKFGTVKKHPYLTMDARDFVIPKTDRRRHFVATALICLVGMAVGTPDAAAQPKHGNLNLGGVIFDLQSSFEAEFNDNINYSNQNKQADIILRPGITVSSFYQVSPLNSISLDLGLSYQQYLFHPSLSSYANFASVSPDSQLAYTIKFDNVEVKLYDSFSYSVQPSDAFGLNPSTGQVITSVQAYGRLMNQIGVNVDWNLKHVQLFAGVYRYDVFPQQSQFSYLRRWQYTGTAGFRYLMSQSVTVGAGLSYTADYFQQPVNNNSHSWYLGPTLNWQINPHWTLDLSGGYVFYNFVDAGSIGDSSQPSTFTGSLTLTNQLTKKISHSLNISRTSNFGYVSNTINLDRVAYQIAWQFRSKWNAKFWAYYEQGTDSGGLLPETYNKYSFSPGLEYQANDRTTVYSYYEYSDKESNIGARSFDRNRIVLGLRYDW